MSDWDLLDEAERELLSAVQQDQGIGGPVSLASRLGWTWQRVVRVMKPLETMRLVRVRRYSKMTIYELAGDGEKALEQRDRTVGTG
jgi:DNA-binding MarR family transcriptional regulator